MCLVRNDWNNRSTAQQLALSITISFNCPALPWLCGDGGPRTGEPASSGSSWRAGIAARSKAAASGGVCRNAGKWHSAWPGNLNNTDPQSGSDASMHACMHACLHTTLTYEDADSMQRSAPGADIFLSEATFEMNM